MIRLNPVNTHGSRRDACRISLIKADGLAESVKRMLGLMMKEMFD
jgi:hypothetical protein